MAEMQKLMVKSSIDGSVEESLFYYPEGKGPVPLLVGLHTWSADRFNQVERMLPFCEERGWALLLPEFRGPNLTRNPRAPEACASKLARQDIMDAAAEVEENYAIDAGKIFVFGGSGGGHMSLMMAGHAPEKWLGVSSWCPITDLAKWHTQNSGYAPHIAACCEGIPGDSPETDAQYRERSPLTHVSKIAKANVFVHHGRFDKSVPFSHTVELIAEVEKHNPEKFFYEIFNGGHDMYYDLAFRWFDQLIEASTAKTELTS